jgi:lipopolysaccharide/colanic/teichoic acid biosynthesis glycosyltransferase
LKPGITGVAQVRGEARDNSDIQNRVAYDLYLENGNLSLEIGIILAQRRSYFCRHRRRNADGGALLPRRCHPEPQRR